MSICVVHCTSERALIAVDTAIFEDSKRTGEMAKMVTFPHARLAIAWRGHALMLIAIASRFHRATRLSLDGFMEFATAIEVLNAARKDVLPHGADVNEGDLIIAGWSDTKQSMLAFVWTLSRGCDWVCHHVKPWRIQGGNPAEKPPGWPEDSVDSVVSVARWCVEQGPAVGNLAGGRILVADVRRDSVSVRDTGSWEAN